VLVESEHRSGPLLDSLRECDPAYDHMSIAKREAMARKCRVREIEKSTAILPLLFVRATRAFGQ
jgi:hypothetical protein